MVGKLRQEAQGPVAGARGLDMGRQEESQRRSGNERGKRHRGTLGPPGNWGEAWWEGCGAERAVPGGLGLGENEGKWVNTLEGAIAGAQGRGSPAMGCEEAETEVGVQSV